MREVPDYKKAGTTRRKLYAEHQPEEPHGEVPDHTENNLLIAIAQGLGANEHIKAVCRMAMNTMNSIHARLDKQTLYSAFTLIERLAGGSEDDLFTMAEVYPNTTAEDFEEHE